jgi:hypothetical protein
MRKKIPACCGIFIIVILLNSQNSFSFSFIKSKLSETKINISTPDYLKASSFVHMSARQFEAASGAKLNFFEKIYFKVVQHKVRRDLKKNPDLLITDYYDQKKDKFRISVLWFVIGAFIGPFGVIAAYTSRQSKGEVSKKNKIISVWLGFLAFIIWFGYYFLF